MKTHHCYPIRSFLIGFVYDLWIQQLTLRKSLDEKKGLTIYLSGGHIVSMVVNEITTDAITGRNQNHDAIVVQTTQIVAAAM